MIELSAYSARHRLGSPPVRRVRVNAAMVRWAGIVLADGPGVESPSVPGSVVLVIWLRRGCVWCALTLQMLLLTPPCLCGGHAGGEHTRAVAGEVLARCWRRRRRALGDARQGGRRQGSAPQTLESFSTGSLECGRAARCISHLGSRCTLINFQSLGASPGTPISSFYRSLSSKQAYSRHSIINFPFGRPSHTMGSGGGLRPPPPTLALASHRHHTTSHCKAKHHAQLLSGSQRSRGSCSDHGYKARATAAKNPARAPAARLRYPLAHPRPHPAFRKPCPPASARPDHHRSRSKRLRAARRRCRSMWSRRRLRGGLRASWMPCDLSFRPRPASSGRLSLSRRR